MPSEDVSEETEKKAEELLAERRKRAHRRAVMIPTLTILAILAIWQLVVAVGLIPNFLLPSPTQVITALVTDAGLLASHSVTTLVESILGLAIGVAVGFLVAVLMDRFEGVALALNPLVTISQTIPTVAIAPLLVLW